MVKKIQIQNLARLPRRKLTVDELLTHESVYSLWAEVQKELPSMTELICIWVDNEEYVHWHTSPMLKDRAIYLAETMKHDMLSSEEE